MPGNFLRSSRNCWRPTGLLQGLKPHRKELGMKVMQQEPEPPENHYKRVERDPGFDECEQNTLLRP